MLDLSCNNIILLEQFLCKMNVSILNLSNNPLNEKFQPLLKTENQQAPLLKEVLQNCFSHKQSVPQWKTEKIESFEDDFLKPKQPNWFDIPMNQTFGGQSKKETVEQLLKEEQQKVIGLQTQLEQLKLQQTQPSQNQEASPLADLEIDINELELNKVISQGTSFPSRRLQPGLQRPLQGHLRGNKKNIRPQYHPGPPGRTQQRGTPFKIVAENVGPTQTPQYRPNYGRRHQASQPLYHH